jgi:glycosyltransferase involved in cell wall biosynthesis
VTYSRPEHGRSLGILLKIFPKLSETFILEEILGLERMGVSLRLYALAAPTDALAHSAVANVRAPLTLVPQLISNQWGEFAARHLRSFMTDPLHYLSAFVCAFGRGQRGMRDFMLAGWLAVQLRNDGVEHLHTHFISTPADLAELVSQMSGLPFSISAHAKDIYLSDQADLRRKLEAASFTVTCTEFNRQTLASIAPQAIVKRMYHGVDRDQFQPVPLDVSDAPPLILSVGRLREKKGLDTLIDACRLLYDRNQVFQCEIVGYGEERDALQARIEKHGLTNQVQLVGALSRQKVIDAYARATVYVQPSRIAADGDRDGIPNVLLEAMAMSLPVVASKVSGIPELIEHGVNGLLVEPDNPGLFADAIIHLIQQPLACAALGARARATVAESFDNDCNLKLLCQLLQDCHEPNVKQGQMQSTSAAPASVSAK